MQFSLENAALLGSAALIGSTLAGTTGFGGAAVLLPILVQIFGVRDAIPILTVAQLIGNGSRVFFHRKDVQWKVVIWFAAGAIPAALLGGYVFAHAASTLILKCLGFFLLGTVAWRWLKRTPIWTMSLKGFTVVGVVFGFLSALVGGVGPFIVPFFLSFGLVKSAFIGTEAMATVTIHVFKLVAYNQTNLLPLQSISVGLALGPVMVLGSWLGKRIVRHLSTRVFVLIVELTLVLAGINFLLKA